jgi:hypothetical protein
MTRTTPENRLSEKVHAQLKASNGISLDPLNAPDNSRIPLNSG